MAYDKAPQDQESPALTGMLRPMSGCAVLFMALFASVHIFHPLSPAATTILSDSAIFLAGAVSAFFIFRIACRVRKETGTWPNAWLALATAQTTYALGDLAWLVTSAIFKQEPFPSAADGLYLAYYPLLALSILLVPGQRVRKEDRAKIVLDILIVMLSALVVFWLFLIQPLLPVYRTMPLSAALVMLYLTADFAILFPLVQIILTKLSGAQRTCILLICAGILFRLLADLNLWKESVTGTASIGKLQDIIEIASHCCLGLAAIAYYQARRHGTPEGTHVPLAYGNSTLSISLPCLCTAVAFWCVVLLHDETHVVPWALQAGVLGVIFPLLILRHALVVADNRKLVQSAEHEIAERRNIMQELQTERDQLDKRVLDRTQQLSLTIEKLRREFAAREEARKELLESENRLSMLIENLPVVLFLVDTEGVVQLLKGKGLGHLPQPNRLAIGRSIFDLEDIYPEAVASAREALGGNTVHGELMIGRTVFDTWYAPHWDVQGTINGIIGVAADITEKKRAEEQLRLTQFSVDHASEAIFWVDDIGRYLYVNEAACTSVGYSREELLDMKIFDINVTFDSATFLDHRSRMKPGQSIIVVAEHRTKYGTLFPVEVTENYFERDGQLIAFTYVRNISERKLAQEALFAEKERLAVTLRSLGEGVITADTDGCVILVNRAAEQLTGWKHADAIGRPLNDIFPLVDSETRRKKELPPSSTLRKTVTQSRGNTVLIGHDGIERLVAYTESPVNDRESRIIGVVLAFRDVTEQMRAQRELLKAEKLESIGVLAGGIAHDFNNLLTSMLGNMSLARRYIPEHDKAALRLQAAERAAARAQDLTRQLLTFTKGGGPIRHAMPIAQVVRESAFFPLSGSNVRCEFALPDDLWPVNADEGQISQVIHNLVLNADQAMPGGGRIRISAENCLLKPDNELGLLPGRYIRIIVSDTGIGIPKEHLSRIFDPYFTTKPTGSGLGLATCYAILRNHDGLISAMSEEGSGTTFTLYLPASQEAGDCKDFNKDGETFLGSGRILVMDDEADLLETAEQLLGHLGFQVTTVQDGAAAFSAYQQANESGKPFRAVIMDITIPGGMGGQELIKKLLLYDTKVRAIISSGYSNDPLMTFYRESGFVGVLTKPYTLEQVATVMRLALQGPAVTSE